MNKGASISKRKTPCMGPYSENAHNLMHFPTHKTQDKSYDELQAKEIARQ
jgi:hypothetical protein